VNTKEYIKSGILESYWAGELTEEEMIEVDRMADLHPEIKAELQEIRDALIEYGHLTQNKPSQEVLQHAYEQIKEGEKDRMMNVIAEDDPEIIIKRVNVVPVWSIAASILLVVSAGFNFLFFTEFKKAKGEADELAAVVNSLEQDQIALANVTNEQALKLEYANLRIAHFLNQDNVHVRMDGLPLSPDSYANVFWNTKSNAVFISVDNLPEPPQGHQYQLWAIKEGQAPIDAGIFDHSLLIQELKVIKGDVVAFAVTLEEEGGSPIATVDQTFVKGFLKKS
jgi:hypothetical protein